MRLYHKTSRKMCPFDENQLELPSLKRALTSLYTRDLFAWHRNVFVVNTASNYSVVWGHRVQKFLKFENSYPMTLFPITKVTFLVY